MMLNCDADKTQRVVDNLLPNAVVYTYEQTEITIEARSGEGEVILRFSNHGGTNGEGKAALMGRIAGIMRPTSGQVVYDEVPIHTLGEQYRDIFGYLPQEFGFHRKFAVKDYLAYAAALKGLPKRQGWQKIQELLEPVSLLGKNVMEFLVLSFCAVLAAPVVISMTVPGVLSRPEGQL